MNSHIHLLLCFALLTWTIADDSKAEHSDSPVSETNGYAANTSIADGDHITQTSCPSKCGNLTVPYPFGIGRNSGCSINPFFEISCNSSFDPPRAFIGTDELEVIGIFENKMHVKNRVVFQCLAPNGHLSNTTTAADISVSVNFSGSPFSFSSENKLTLVGCNSVSNFALQGPDEDDYDTISYCISMCNETEDLQNGSCSGIGCCQSSIPKGLQSFTMAVGFLSSKTSILSFNPCRYSFLAQKDNYAFHTSDISANIPTIREIVEPLPIVIDWEIGHKNCSQAQINQDVVCQGQSFCVDSDTGLGGYRCNCSQGYTGNPYLSPGCQDINECEFTPCHEKATCTNLPGSFNCTCNSGYIGDGMLDGLGCMLRPHPTKTVMLTGLLAGLVSFFALLFSFWLYRMLKKRKTKNLKQKFFKRNGGLLLKRQISDDNHILEKIRIFSAKELDNATDKFNESRILGQGGQGTVYKGMLSDGRIIAVKKSRQLDEKHLDEFINEVCMLSQINHKNVVKFHGCCLETQVPSLVYEFASNGTLYDLIHDGSTSFSFTWDMRLRIASEIANGLEYLHNATTVPIYHRDMKSNNVLLDEKYRAKISDFGISRSIAIDKTHLSTKVQGTFGYVDPEYFQRGKFTEKSDVYSFGVMLVELLTGQKPISTNRTDEERSLVTCFLLATDEDHIRTILDPNIVEQIVTDKQIAVANLARRCLNFNGSKRPNVREVAMELESIRSSENPLFAEPDIQDMSLETDSLVLSDFQLDYSMN